jgi:serine/threonine protein kinase
MEKQLFVYASSGRPFDVPEVYNSGTVNGCFYYDMEYCEGIDLPTYLGKASVDDIRPVLDRLLDSLRFFASSPSFENDYANSFRTLARRVLTVTRAALGLSAESAIAILEALDRMDSSEVLKPTLCHGDLTLENILVTPSSRLLLLDFLDSPLVHYWQDFAKLDMDIDVHWYARKYPMISEWVLCWLRGRLKEFISNVDPNYISYHKALVALNVVRILPYTKQGIDRENLLRYVNITFHDT